MVAFLPVVLIAAICFFFWIRKKKTKSFQDQAENIPLVIPSDEKPKRQIEERNLSDEEKEKLRFWISGPSNQFYLEAHDSGDPKDLPKRARRRFNKWKREKEAINAAYEQRECNPDLNTNSVEQHRRRMSKYRRSLFKGTMEYVGPRGGKYRINPNGRKSYDVE